MPNHFFSVGLITSKRCEFSMVLKEIKAIVFDMGGVLYDTPREIVIMIRFIFDELGLHQFKDMTDSHILSISSKADHIFDHRLVSDNVGPHWLPDFDDSVEYNRIILEILGVAGDLNELATQSHRAWEGAYKVSRPRFIEACRPVLESLHEQGYLLGIASNRRNDPIPHLEDANTLQFFDSVQYSCVPGFRKPSPFMLVQAASELGVNPRKCIYVGDKVEYDVGAAMRAEFMPILIIWCDPSEVEKAPRGTCIISHIDELLDVIPHI